jgi:hypothetical protein
MGQAIGRRGVGTIGTKAVDTFFSFFEILVLKRLTLIPVEKRAGS